jgi:hypothetical protein
MRSAHFSVGAAPVESAEKGGHAYMAARGLRPALHTNHAIIAPQMTERVAHAYSALPDFDPAAVPAFHAMREEVKRQFDHLTGPRNKGGMGIEVNSVSKDPYGAAGLEGQGQSGHWTRVVPEMRHDFTHNNRLDVLSTKVTGEHRIFSNDENDMFRAVHDVFGHLAVGRGIDKHGEEAAFQKHAQMFSPLARGALATETRGQNSALHHFGSFQDQKIAVLPAHLTHPGLARQGSEHERRIAAEQARQGLPR